MGHWPDRPAANRRRYRRDGDRTPGRANGHRRLHLRLRRRALKGAPCLGLGFAGATYEQLFFVCDAQVASAGGDDLNVFLGERGLLLQFPVRSSGMQRLIGLVPPEFNDRDDLDFEVLRDSVERLLGVHVTAVNWFSPYRVHHRVAESFAAGAPSFSVTRRTFIARQADKA